MNATIKLASGEVLFTGTLEQAQDFVAAEFIGKEQDALQAALAGQDDHGNLAELGFRVEVTP